MSKVTVWEKNLCVCACACMCVRACLGHTIPVHIQLVSLLSLPNIRGPSIL